ncbi:LysR family transcriptional regulator [uncultured Agrococcus sp.]|uniref:LysR family transcriptional regulator n=1 Tax=uncultured Agrococcus sp. TaxID=382258 RepID=UPI0025E759C7|nr:LysR family transcriptional regulator [uncultured Agrococcus sp.]
MEIQQLRAWRSVVATGSVRGAAEALGYSPSAISQQVSALQRATGIPLFARSGRGLDPTEQGAELAEQIDRVLGELGALEDFARDLRTGQRSGLTIAYFSSLGPTWMPEILSSLADEFPEARLELVLADEFDTARSPKPDLQLTVLPRDPAVPSGYEARLLTEDAFVAALPTAHPLADLDEIPLGELDGFDWISNDITDGFCHRIVMNACAAAGFQPDFRIEATDLSSALALVAKGIGISLVPALVAPAIPAGVVLKPVTGPTPTRFIYALIPKGSTERPLVRAALERASAIASCEAL